MNERKKVKKRKETEWGRYETLLSMREALFLLFVVIATIRLPRRRSDLTERLRGRLTLRARL